MPLGQPMRIGSQRSPAGQDGHILAVDDQGIHVATGDGSLILEELQLPGKRRMAVSDLLRGNPALFTVGEPLGDAIADASGDQCGNA